LAIGERRTHFARHSVFSGQKKRQRPQKPIDWRVRFWL